MPAHGHSATKRQAMERMFCLREQAAAQFSRAAFYSSRKKEAEVWGRGRVSADTEVACLFRVRTEKRSSRSLFVGSSPRFRYHNLYADSTGLIPPRKPNSFRSPALDRPNL